MESDKYITTVSIARPPLPRLDLLRASGMLVDDYPRILPVFIASFEIVGTRDSRGVAKENPPASVVILHLAPAHQQYNAAAPLLDSTLAL